MTEPGRDLGVTEKILWRTLSVLRAQDENFWHPHFKNPVAATVCMHFTSTHESLSAAGIPANNSGLDRQVGIYHESSALDARHQQPSETCGAHLHFLNDATQDAIQPSKTRLTEKDLDDKTPSNHRFDNARSTIEMQIHDCWWHRHQLWAIQRQDSLAVSTIRFFILYA